MLGGFVLEQDSMCKLWRVSTGSGRPVQSAFDGPVHGCYYQAAGWSSLVARWAHNPKVGGSNPPPATNLLQTPNVGEWLSLVEHLVRDQGVGGSNPLSPTI